MATKTECDTCSTQIDRTDPEASNWFEVYSIQISASMLRFNYCSLICLEEGARRLQLEYPHLR